MCGFLHIRRVRLRNYSSYLIYFSAFIFQAVLCICNKIRLHHVATGLHYGEFRTLFMQISVFLSIFNIFLQTHCRGNPKFDFHKYMMRVLEADFKKVVGIRFVIFTLI